MEGQVSVFNFRGGPCYRCVFPAPLAAEAGRRCSDNGVLGTVPGERFFSLTRYSLEYCNSFRFYFQTTFPCVFRSIWRKISLVFRIVLEHISIFSFPGFRLHFLPLCWYFSFAVTRPSPPNGVVPFPARPASCRLPHHALEYTVSLRFVSFGFVSIRFGRSL